MRLLAAFLKLVRLPNLIFIALTQFLFHECIVHRILDKVGRPLALEGSIFNLVVAASVLIAAAGYIINDYFDINIDQVNKPRGNVVDTIVSRRWAMLWHFVLSGAGLIISLYISWKTGLWYIVIANFFCIFLLFAYSVTLKRKLLIGNYLISALTAWVILIISLSELNFITLEQPAMLEATNKITRLGALYAGFAFIITLIREAIKDLEDRHGDAKYGCKTMPILWGVNATKVYVAVWLIVLLAAVIILQVYVVPFRWWWPLGYSVVFILLPLLYIFIKLYRATSPSDYHQLSTWTKFVMFRGIISMSFFYFYL